MNIDRQKQNYKKKVCIKIKLSHMNKTENIVDYTRYVIKYSKHGNLVRRINKNANS